MTKHDESFQAVLDYHNALDMFDRDVDKALSWCLEKTLRFPCKSNEEIGEYMKSLYAMHLRMGATVYIE